MAKNDNQPLSSPELLVLVYDELRRLAAHYMRNEPAGHSLQATALVHEAYIKLIEQHQDAWQDRTHFFAMAAQAMRRVLVDHARARRASKRGGNYVKLPLEESLVVFPDQARELVDLDEALERLEQIDP
ncbi:MAG: RNA polymerase subunit sigma-70, partial [Acidobacteriaceae bacterium]|nr:RNA polymerase subunit sigma-70 [Acidobacteriaceae bacterium]